MRNSLFSAASEQAISISELNHRARNLLEQSFPPLWVSGEISNLTKHGSGHWYFSLKDEKAQVRCVMFRHRNQYLDFQVKEGMQVEARVIVSLYEPRGDFQLNVETMRPSGLGALYEAFARLKTKLEAEGLFAQKRKKLLPTFPQQIGIVTSPQAAALRDVLTTLQRRMPSIPIVLYPTPVQGRGACLQIAQAITTAGKRGECDVLVLCRGGGSIEDLWEFNEEIVARAMADSPIPIVCGVGHETDFTIADFVADVRAPTPTGAAELASPNRADLAHKVEILQDRLSRRMLRLVEARMQQLDHLSKRLAHPGERLRHQSAQLAQLALRLNQAVQRGMENQRWRIQQLRSGLVASRPDIGRRQQTQTYLAARLALAMGQRLRQAQHTVARLTGHLAHLNPQAVLERGYSIVRDKEGRVVVDSASVEVGNELRVTFAVGSATTKVTSKTV
jgi:exodeoxyribonuclease VII large subunit